MVGFGGNGWDVPVLVACILACFIIAASTPVLLVLYVFIFAFFGIQSSENRRRWRCGCTESPPFAHESVDIEARL